jgi:hypothetical protein
MSFLGDVLCNPRFNPGLEGALIAIYELANAMLVMSLVVCPRSGTDSPVGGSTFPTKSKQMSSLVARVAAAKDREPPVNRTRWTESRREATTLQS